MLFTYGVSTHCRRVLLYLRATVAIPQRQLPRHTQRPPPPALYASRHLRITCTCTLQSTLLNQLVTKLTGAQAKGFTVAATHKPCTKGLHVWSKPIQRTTADGKKMNVVRARHRLKQAQGRRRQEDERVACQAQVEAGTGAQTARR